MLSKVPEVTVYFSSYFWILLKILARGAHETASGSQSFLNAALHRGPHRAIADRVAARGGWP